MGEGVGGAVGSPPPSLYVTLYVSLNLTKKLHIHVALPSPPQVIPGPLQQTRL